MHWRKPQHLSCCITLPFYLTVLSYCIQSQIKMKDWNSCLECNNSNWECTRGCSDSKEPGDSEDSTINNSEGNPAEATISVGLKMFQTMTAVKT